MARGTWREPGPDDPIFKEGWSVAAPWRPTGALAAEAPGDGGRSDDTNSRDGHGSTSPGRTPDRRSGKD